jgi:hypothetical protein
MAEEGQAAPIDGQTAPTNWHDGLQDTFKSDPSIKTFVETEDGLNKFVESHLNLRKKMGNAVWVPDPDKATPEEVQAFRTKLGVPESPDKYELKYKEHEAFKYDEETDKIYKTLAHKIGLTPKQAQDLADFDSDRLVSAYEAVQKKYNDASEEVKKEWGNDYQVNLDRANNVIRQFADEKDMEIIKRYENDPALCRIFNKIGNSMSEHKFVQSDSGNDIAGNRQALEDEASGYLAKMQDPKTPDAEKKILNRKATAIYEKLWGTKQVSGSAELNKFVSG